jgi:glycosyltransferase involved in cell wall biosynthesis
MNIVQITPGAGAMYCGNCLRDNALVAALKRMGHSVRMLPLYLPLTLDEDDESEGAPIFFSGINVYLQQKSALFREAPSWLHNLLSSRRLLKWAAGRAAKTRADELGELTLSMLKGELGNQARELDGLITWLKSTAKPDIICLSNALLVGMVRRLKSELNVPLVCMLQGEDGFLDSLPAAHREECWSTLAERARECDKFIATSEYFANLMGARLGVGADRMAIAHNGINLQGYAAVPEKGAEGAQPKTSGAPVIGYFARMCREKGLDILVDAFIALRKNGRVGEVTLKVGGSCGPADEVVVEELRQKLREARLEQSVSFHRNLSRSAKLEFLKNLTLFSVPSRFGEAFGLYVIEALAAGVPVVEPRIGAFPEIVEATGGGVLYEPNETGALAAALEKMLLAPEAAKGFGRTGQKIVFERYSSDAMAAQVLKIYEQVVQNCSINAVPVSA